MVDGCVSCSILVWDVHANEPYTIPVTLDDLDIDCLHAVILSYCIYWFDLFFWLCGLIDFRFEGLNYYPNYFQMLGFITVTVFTFENLSQSCALRCALFILTCILSAAFADEKALWIHLKGKRVSFLVIFDQQAGVWCADRCCFSYCFLFSLQVFRQYYSFKRPHLSHGQTLSQLPIAHLQINAYVGPRRVFSPRLVLILHSKWTVCL